MKSGQNPPKTDKVFDMTEIRSYVSNCKYDSNNKILVKEEVIPFDNEMRKRIVVPVWFIKHLLVQIHFDQNCPEVSQMKKIFTRYFFGFRANNMFQEVYDECSRCQARKQFPKELEQFTSITNPSNPGEIFVSDVIKRARQLIFISRDSFSDFVTTSLINSEKAEDLKEGIIATTIAVRKPSEITVRVDNAPGFIALVRSEDKDLGDLKIKLDISNHNNKNGLAIVDKAIQEFEKELKTMSPEGKEITSSQLAQATLILNTRIRNRSLSSREILFSRDQFSGTNLDLKDEELKNSKMLKKINNHQYSEKSKCPKMIKPLDAKAKKGDAVYLKDDGGKHTLREKYVVLEADNDTVKIAKLLHAMDRNLTTKISSKTSEVKQTEIFKCYPDRATSENSPEQIDTVSKVENAEKTLSAPKDLPLIWSVFPSSSEDSSLSLKHKWQPFSLPDGSSENDSSEETCDTGNETLTHDHSELTIDDEDNSVSQDDGGDNLDTPDTHSNHEATQLDHQNVSTEVTDHYESDVTITDVLESSIDDSNDNKEDEPSHDWSIPNPTELPKKGDRIEYLDDKNGSPVLRKATVTLMYSTVQRKHPGWVNILNDGAHKQSSIKLNDYKWRSLKHQEIEDERSSDNDEDDTNVLEVAFNKETPLHDHAPIPFPDVQNFDNVLPLTSTPESSTAPIVHFPQRTSSVRPRGPLPMEFEDSPLASGSKQPSRYKKAIAEKAKAIQKAFTRRVPDEPSDSE